MPSKKTTSAKSVRGKKRPRLTGAIGPKATVTVVIVVLAGGLILGAHQRSKTIPTSDPRVDLVPMPEAPEKKLPAVNASASAAMPAAPAAAVTAKAPSVTLTGCLEGADDSFRLKDTAGVDAPRSRSWKSGFLKKGPATIELVDAGHTVKLADNVGRRVSVTGQLVDREMRVRSMRRLSASCTN